jgi:dTMP kinase
MKGKVITIEGGDRVGKHTQSILLTDYLLSKGINTKQISFPNYGSIQAMPVENYLAGNFPDISSIEASMLYAFDRSITCREEKIKEFIEDGGWVVFDRYVPSNMMYQTAREVPDENLDLSKPLPYDSKLVEDINYLEYFILGLPKPDAIFYLNLDRKINDVLLKKDLGTDGGDIHEKNHTLLDKAANIGLQLAQKYNWNIIQCNNPRSSSILNPQAIHLNITKIVDTMIDRGDS